MALHGADHLAVVRQRRRRDLAHADDRRHDVAPRARFGAAFLPRGAAGQPTARDSGRWRQRLEHGRAHARVERLTSTAQPRLRKKRVRPVVKSDSRVPTATTVGIASALAQRRR
jgi:hypothetical protein